MKIIEGNTYYINGCFYDYIGEPVVVTYLNKSDCVGYIEFSDGTHKRVCLEYLQRQPEKLQGELGRDIDRYKKGEKKTDIFELEGLDHFKEDYVDGKYTKVLSISTEGEIKVGMCINKYGIVKLINIGYITNLTEKDIDRLTKEYITY